MCLHTQNHLYALPELNTKLNTKLFTYHSFELVWAHLNTFCFSPPQSTMSDVSPGEEFVSSLGADQSIRITVRPVATVHNTRTAKLGGAKTNTITYTHTFLVKNTRSDSVTSRSQSKCLSALMTESRYSNCLVSWCLLVLSFNVILQLASNCQTNMQTICYE